MDVTWRGFHRGPQGKGIRQGGGAVQGGGRVPPRSHLLMDSMKDGQYHTIMCMLLHTATGWLRGWLDEGVLPDAPLHSELDRLCYRAGCGHRRKPPVGLYWQVCAAGEYLDALPGRRYPRGRGFRPRSG